MFVHHPDAKHAGTERVGSRIVRFNDGRAEVSVPAVLRHYRDLGYQVTDEPAVQVDAGEFVALESLTVPQLRDYAAEHGIEVPAKAKKADLVDTIAAAPLGPIAGSVDNGDGTSTWVDDEGEPGGQDD